MRVDGLQSLGAGLSVARSPCKGLPLLDGEGRRNCSTDLSRLQQSSSAEADSPWQTQEGAISPSMQEKYSETKKMS